MRVVDQSNWGFLLEHEGMPFFIPLSPRGMPFQMQSRVQLDENLIVVIKSTDLPFYFDQEKTAHILTEKSHYVPLIKACIVHHISRR